MPIDGAGVFRSSDLEQFHNVGSRISGGRTESMII